MTMLRTVCYYIYTYVLVTYMVVVTVYTYVLVTW